MISENRFKPSSGLRLSALSGLLLGSGSAAASGESGPSAVWLWLASLPDWLLVALVAILLMGLAGLGLLLYCRWRQRAPASRATALTLIGSGLAGVLLALVVADDWHAFVLDQIASLPPTAIGPPIATLLAEPPAEVAMRRPQLPASALAARAGRARHADINFNALDAAELRLNLFDDLELVAVRDREVELDNARVWVGRIPDADYSEVFLTAKGRVLTGTVSYDGRLFEILYVNGATHAVREIDTAQIPGDIVEEAGDLSASDLGAEGELLGADASTGQVIDVLVAYTPKARTNAGGDSGMQTRILNAVAAANQGYLNSNIDIHLNLVHTVLVSYTETGAMSTGLSYLRGTTDGYMDEVHALRNQYGADVVVLINTDTDVCGVAYVMRTVSTSFASSAFAAVRDGCLTAGSFAHEIGHIQGNMHDPESSSSAGAYPDSYGHRVCGKFRDIMSYSCSGEPRVNYFSNPEIMYQTWPTGILGERDTARSMGVTAATVASFRSSVSAPTLPAAPSSLQATLASSDSIELTWSDNASWNTRKAASGTHVIRADSTDAAGNLGTVSITVTK